MKLTKTEQKILSQHVNGYVSASSGWKKRTNTRYGRREHNAVVKLMKKGIVEHVDTLKHDNGTWWTIDSVYKIVDKNYL